MQIIKLDTTYLADSTLIAIANALSMDIDNDPADDYGHDEAIAALNTMFNNVCAALTARGVDITSTVVCPHN